MGISFPGWESPDRVDLFESPNRDLGLESPGRDFGFESPDRDVEGGCGVDLEGGCGFISWRVRFLEELIVVVLETEERHWEVDLLAMGRGGLVPGGMEEVGLRDGGRLWGMFQRGEGRLCCGGVIRCLRWWRLCLVIVFREAIKGWMEVVTLDEFTETR
jgi:hypothetical protein